MSDTAHAVTSFPKTATIHRGGTDLSGRGGLAASDAIANITRDAGLLYDRLSPDLIIIVGDRLDMIPSAVAALPFNIPLMHLHGGEVTEGAIDDRTRHALSKLSHIHCVSSEDARTNLMAMGEEPWRIHVTGAPGLDTLKSAPEMSAQEFFDAIKMPIDDQLRLVTVHPETNSTKPMAPLEAVLGALDLVPSPTLITAPNSDPGGADCRSQILDYVSKRPWVTFVESLGSILYPNALRHASLMAGNSSSGIIEASLFGLPVINVGGRQQGRMRGKNVFDCLATIEAVAALLKELPGKKFENTECLYGDGNASQRIIDVLTDLPDRQCLLTKHVWHGKSP